MPRPLSASGSNCVRLSVATGFNPTLLRVSLSTSAPRSTTGVDFKVLPKVPTAVFSFLKQRQHLSFLSLLFPFEWNLTLVINHQRDGFPPPQTEGSFSHSHVPVFHGMNQGGQYPGAAGTDGVSNGHRATMYVYFFGVDVQLPVNGDGRCAEGFIDFMKIDVLNFEAIFCQNLRLWTGSAPPAHISCPARMHPARLNAPGACNPTHSPFPGS